MSEQYQAVYYRNSQYSSYEEAYKNGGVYHWEETYGYSATTDAFINAVGMLSCLDKDAIKEFRFIWTIDGVRHPETDYRGSQQLLEDSYDYFSGIQIPESTNKSLTLN
jgi:hypothetical protein